MPPEENQATATCNMYNKSAEVWSCVLELCNRTDKHTHHNTSHLSRGQSKKTMVQLVHSNVTPSIKDSFSLGAHCRNQYRALGVLASAQGCREAAALASLRRWPHYRKRDVNHETGSI